MKLLRTFPILALVLPGCNDSGTKVQPRVVMVEAKPVEPKATETPVPTPTPEPTPAPTAEPTPDPTPTEPTPAPDPNEAVLTFFQLAGGQWLSNCVTNEDKSSILPGFKFDKREYLWMQYQYKNSTCLGESDPRDGRLVYWLVDTVEAQPDGWFLFKGHCNSAWACQDKKQAVMVKYQEGTLLVREVQDPEGPTLKLSHGPSK